MFALAVFTGLILTGVVIGVWRTRRGSSQEVPNPFQRVRR